MKKRLAIVGSGISAMTCLHYLKDEYEISLFDKNDYAGGHTHTHAIEENGRSFKVDTGFIVFNRETYPNLLALFSELGVLKQESEMSFSVFNQTSGLYYSGGSLSALFAQKKNLFSSTYWRFLSDIRKFFRVALADAAAIAGSPETIRDYCRRRGLSDFFVDNFLAPMSSAVWSVPQRDVHDFPIALLLPFFRNHGLLRAVGQYQWYTVRGGSDTYTRRILESARPDLHLGEAVVSAIEDADGVALLTEKGEYRFDYAVLAAHADTSLGIARGLSAEKRALLSAFGYNRNLAVLHTDESVMPPDRRVWSSWNQVIGAGAEKRSTCVYWMNRLQRLPAERDYFVSINPLGGIDERKVIKRIAYEHPNFSLENFRLQPDLQKLNEDTRIFFAGAYFGYGFHEDGAKAGLAVADKLKKR